MTDEPKPKPCPFCGYQPIVNTTGDRPYVGCDICNLEPVSITAWNSRPIEEALRTRIAELEAERYNDRAAITTRGPR